jgi:hypothetical protein
MAEDELITVTFPASRNDPIERALFARIANEPAFVLWLSDRVAAFEIVTRLRLMPPALLNGILALIGFAGEADVGSPATLSRGRLLTLFCCRAPRDFSHR